MSTKTLEAVDTKELKKEMERRDLLALGRKDPIALSGAAQLAILTHGLNKKDADEVSKLARKGEIEKAVDKLLFDSRYKPIKPSTA